MSANFRLLYAKLKLETPVFCSYIPSVELVPLYCWSWVLSDILTPDDE